MISGCRVIGFAGTNDKCEWLVNEVGYDHAANYKTVNIAEYLKQQAPKGIDCYFDNVGGELSSIIISQMNEFGRVAVCGAISGYNETDPEKRKGRVKSICYIYLTFTGIYSINGIDLKFTTYLLKCILVDNACIVNRKIRTYKHELKLKFLFKQN